MSTLTARTSGAPHQAERTSHTATPRRKKRARLEQRASSTSGAWRIFAELDAGTVEDIIDDVCEGAVTSLATVLRHRVTLSDAEAVGEELVVAVGRL